MTTPRPDSRLGTDLGPYRIEAVIGRGGMGVVYLAEQRDLGRKVALKLLPDELSADADFRARFERESRLAAAIDHPNVIPLYEAGAIEGTLFLAMRYVEGIDLASRLREGPLPIPVAVDILGQIAGALDAAHARGLVHRDIKPGNVLLDRAGGDEHPHAYLTDFGLTKQAGTDSGLTRAGSFMGTPAYMAPEQVDGTEVDGRADQYALGCVAFECLTGSVPFKREKEVAVALAHLKDPVPSAVAVRPELPSAVDGIIAKAMAKDREARYPSCAAFIEDLRSALGGAAVVARPIAAPGRRRRTPLLVAAVLGLVLVAVAGLAFVSGLGGPGSGGASPSGSAPGAAVSPSGPTPGSDIFPNAAETTLLAKLPADTRRLCIRGPTTPITGLSGAIAPPLARVRCSGSFTFDATQLGQTGLTAADAIQRTAADRGVQPGDCEVDAPAIGLWSLGAGPLGTVLCYQDGVNGVIEWTLDEETLLLKVSVQYADEKGMLDLWIGYRDKVGSNVGSAPFPTTAEEALLRRLPTSLRADCQRGSYGLIANKLRVKPVASITCPLGPDSGAKRVDLLQISDFEDVTASEVVAAIGAEPGRCPRTGPADDRWSNGERDVGAVVCYADLLDQIVAWSYDDDRLVARASSRGGADLAPGAGAAFARLWDWWLASAKTISQ